MTREPNLNTFSPREVQARVRAGESAEAVATSTGWDLGKVLRYAEPLLAERSFMAQQATSVEIRRSGGSVTLDESVTRVLGVKQAQAVSWDAYRREDGRWVVTAALADGARAEWTYDHHGRNLHALDDTARALMGAQTAPEQATALDIDIAAALDLAGEPAVARDQPRPRPRLVSVPDTAATDSPDTRNTRDATDDASGESGGAADVAARGLDEAEVVEPRPRPQSGTPAPATYEQETIAVPREELQPASRTAKGKARRGRTSVPSWDEILFGAGRADD